MKLNIGTKLSEATFPCSCVVAMFCALSTHSFVSPSENIHLPVEENKASDPSAVR